MVAHWLFVMCQQWFNVHKHYTYARCIFVSQLHPRNCQAYLLLAGYLEVTCGVVLVSWMLPDHTQCNSQSVSHISNACVADKRMAGIHVLRGAGGGGEVVPCYRCVTPFKSIGLVGPPRHDVIMRVISAECQL